ncbi:glycoside hydrolase family 65 protein [Spirochaeta dissipatitropha]
MSHSEHPYELDGWRITETEFHPEKVAADETVFALANGHIGIRGTFEEQRCIYHNGTYINGFYETEPIVYGESAYGFPKLKQQMLNITDGNIIELYVDEDPLDLSTGTVHEYRRSLDMRSGISTRHVRWESPGGKIINLNVRRLVSFRRKHVAAIDWECIPENESAVLTIMSKLEGKQRAVSSADDPRVAHSLSRNALIPKGKKIDDLEGSMQHITRNTGLGLLVTMRNILRTKAEYSAEAHTYPQEIVHSYRVEAEPGQIVHLDKIYTYHTSMDKRSPDLNRPAKRVRNEAYSLGFEGLAKEQRDYLQDFWKHTDVEIQGDIALQQSLRFNMFHLLQAAGQDGFTNIGAKGLTGEGYEGHYFWDTEIYALPFFTYTKRDIARKLLEFRIHTLDQARARARELHHKGALYPWRTINGNEASAYFPAGTAQYHINADIVFAMKKYVLATGDENLLLQGGAEVVIETARFWYDLGDFIPSKGFCINEVTGPNEYTTLVNNNVFTNMMARQNLQYAVELEKWLSSEHPALYDDIVDRLILHPRESVNWAKAAKSMYIPYDEKKSLYPQDENFFDKAVWDFKNTPKSNYPLLLYYHPLTIYRYQVLKQPDLVLALFLQGQHFSPEEKRLNFDYYDPLTTGDSSLSACVQSIVAAEVGNTEKAYHYFMKTVRMDLDDVNGNVKDGVHTAAMAGSWLSMIYGFIGLRDYEGLLSFNPHLPDAWESIRTNLQYRGSSLAIELNRKGLQLSWNGAEEIKIEVRGAEYSLEARSSISVGIM